MAFPQVPSRATHEADIAAAKQRANHTGTQSADTVVDGTANKAYTAAEKSKLGAIADGATANAADAQLRDRSTHTGTQPASTVMGLAAVATSGAYADLTGKPTGGGGTASDATTTSNGLVRLAGDLTGVASAPTLKQVGAAGTFGTATRVPRITVDGAGRVTAVVEVAVSGTGGTTAGITPEQYGAVGDRKTDDSAAIQKAINAASALSDGIGSVQVVCQSGRGYRVANALIYKPNVELVGNGATFVGPINGYAQISSNNNPAVPGAADVAGQTAGAAITDAGGNAVLYGVKIRDLNFTDYRYGVLTAGVAWSYPVLTGLTFYNCNIGVFAYQGSQQMRMFACRSDGSLPGTTFVGSASAWTSGHPYAGQDNYFTDQFIFDAAQSRDRDKSTSNPTFDAWFQAAILRPTAQALSARYPNGYVYPFAASDDACQVSGRNIYIPQRNGRVTFHPQVRTLHSQDSPRGVMLVANPANIDVADIGGEGMFPQTPRAMVTVLATNGVNPSGVFRNVDGLYVSPGTASYAVEVRNGSSGGVDANTKMLVGLNLQSGGTGKVNNPGQWALLP